MAKRIVTRIGNIFCVEIDNEYKCYFQYVANDKNMLNSSTIRVFKKHYAMDATPKMEEIVSDEMSFCAHTILRVGIENGSWYKVGTCKDIGEMSDLKFQFGYIWTVNGERIDLSDEELSNLGNEYHLGPVFSYKNILYRIKHGVYPDYVYTW